MSKYVIKGGRKLNGKLCAQSAKNAVLPMLAASILTDQEVVIKNCPKIQDVFSMINILNSLGVKTKFEDDCLIIDSKAMHSHFVDEKMAKELRSSIFMLGALIGRVKKAKLSYPGGCNIGLRPIDIHLGALREMGVSIREFGGQIYCKVKRLQGKKLYLDFPSVGATENIMLSAVLSEGKTEIHNPAKEPEIVDLMKFLNSMGAKVYGAGTSIIFIEGVKKLHGTEFLPMGDRIEVGTFLIGTAITGGEIEIKGCEPKNIWSLIHKLCDNTCTISAKNDIIYLKSGMLKKAFSLSTGPFPSFPTDLQAQAMALATVSDGISVVSENVFETRFNHVSELIKMGADITVKGKTAIIKGVKQLNGAHVFASDLRGGASLVLAGLCANGETVVDNAFHIERGYFDLDKKLANLGGEIKRI